jgi:CheY-like chemotaxis protein
MTANAMEGDREACLAAGMNDYLAKPMRVQQLAEIIEKLMPVIEQRRAMKGRPSLPPL